MFQRINTITFCIYSLFATAAFARHAHRRPLHRHVPRSEESSSAIVLDEPQPILTSTLDAPSPSFTAGDAMLDDILKIQSGLDELPEDLLAIIAALEHRLGEIEKVLAGYLDGPALPTGTSLPVWPIGPVLSPAPTSLPSNAPEETSTEADSSQAPSTVTITTEPDAPTITSSPTTTSEQQETSSFLTTRSTRITRTLTLMTTIRPSPPPLATGVNNDNNNTLPGVSNGTTDTGIFTPPAPWPKPYLVSGFFSVVTVSSTVDSNVSSDSTEMSPTPTP